MTAATAGPLTRLDESLLRSTRELLGGTPGVPVARALSHLGEHALGWIALGAAGWAGGRRRRSCHPCLPCRHAFRASAARGRGEWYGHCVRGSG